MDIRKLSEVINNPFLEDNIKEKMIINVLSEDPNVLLTLLGLISSERKYNKEIISDLNLEVSRYQVHINDKSLLKKNLSFLNEETKKLYDKWKDFISPLFNNKF